MSPSGSGRLEGKTAVVTGGGSGIGRATAELFCHEGARVLVLGRSKARLRETVAAATAAGGVASALSVDVGDPACAELVEAWVQENFDGAIHVLVNCAATYDLCPAAQLRPAELRDTLRINLRGPFLLMRLAVKRMAQAGGGSVINVSTVNSLVADMGVGVSAYAASKGGLNGLTRQAGVEFADRGVRVNAVVPGVVDTEMLSEWRESEDDIDGWLTAHVPMARLARPDEVAAACLFLASDDSTYVTGAVIPVDGGMSAV